MDTVHNLLALGRGLDDSAAAADVRRRLVAVQQARGEHLPQELAADLELLVRYLDGGPAERRELLGGGLYVRCAAAHLFGGYTGALEVEAGSGGGCVVETDTLMMPITIRSYSTGGLAASGLQVWHSTRGRGLATPGMSSELKLASSSAVRRHST